MPKKINSKSAKKESLHPRNLHRGRYDLTQLCASSPDLKPFVAVNQYNNETIDFSNPEAVKALNKALLKHFYQVDGWDIPEGYLCPPIPGRADYIHYMADLLAESNNGVIPIGKTIKVLDIGIGANGVYPLIGNSIYGWQFVGTDTDAGAIRSVNKIVSLNKHLRDTIETRVQTNSTDIFKSVVNPDEIFDLVICNPPFHASLQEAQAGNAKKWESLSGEPQKPLLNFGGKNNELWYPGGEAAFINRMIGQSAPIARQCLWFTSLVSKKDTLPVVYNTLKKFKAVDVKTIEMAQGQKVSRVIAWTFLDEAEREDWLRKK